MKPSIMINQVSSYIGEIDLRPILALYETQGKPNVLGRVALASDFARGLSHP